MSEEQTEHPESGVDRRQWHVGKEIPLALVGTLLVQTIGFIWSIAGLYNRVDNLVSTVNEMKAERYTKDDARRDREIMSLVVDAQRARDNELERRIQLLETYNRSLPMLPSR